MSAPFTEAEWAEIRREGMTHIAGLGEVSAERLPAVLLPYQGKAVGLLDSTALCPVLVVEKSRRIGLTWGLASYAVLRAGRARTAGGMDVMYISYAQEMTREFIDACAMWARAFAVAALEVEEFLFEPADAEGNKAVMAFRIRFASGFEILALSSAPRGLRGKQGVVIIDEAAFVDSLEELLKAALAFLMWGGQVVACSTHNGVDNPFNALVQDTLAKRRPYAHLRIDLDDALRDGLYQRICLVTGRAWTPETEAAWRQSLIEQYGEHADEELFCVPTQGSGAWLTAPLIEARMTLSAEDAPIVRIALPADFLHRGAVERAHLLAPGREAIAAAVDGLDGSLEHALGYDPARVSDPAIITLLAVEKGLRRRAALTVEMRGVPFEEQKAIARDIMRAAPRLVGAAIDATGMGMNLSEDLGREFGLSDADHPGGTVAQVRLSQAWYNEHMPPLKAAFEDDMIALVRDAEHLSDLRLVKVIRGIPGIPAERVGAAGAKRHGDFAVALALAHFASRRQWHEYAYVPAPQAAALTGTPAGRGFMYADDGPVAAERSPFRSPLGARVRGGI